MDEGISKSMGKGNFLEGDEGNILASKAVRGCLKSRNQLIASYQHLVHSIARKFFPKGSAITSDDLVQAANEALLNEFEKFDPKKGSFSTWANDQIKWAIMRELTNSGTFIKLPEYLITHTGRIKLGTLIREWLNIEDNKGIKMEDFLLEKGVKVIMGTFALYVQIYKGVMSIDSTLVVGDIALHETICSSSDYLSSPEKLIFRKEFDKLIASLPMLIDTVISGSSLPNPERARQIMHARFLHDDGAQKTLQELGTEYDITQERVRQIQQDVLTLLREKIGENPL